MYLNIILASLIEPGIGLIFWTGIVFLLLLFLLGKFAWKPILSAIRSREEGIAKALASADAALKDMRELKAANENIMNQARAERDAMLKEARETKESIVAEAKQKAQAEADRIMLTTRTQIANEKNAAMDELKRQVAVLSIEIAEKILKAELSNDEKQKQLVSNLMKDVNLN